jgi:hypothetical protein
MISYGLPSTNMRLSSKMGSVLDEIIDISSGSSSDSSSGYDTEEEHVPHPIVEPVLLLHKGLKLNNNCLAIIVIRGMLL